MNSGAWITLMSEGFEGTFPIGDWFVFDYDGSFNGEYIWAPDDFKPFNGIYSAWPAAGGADGTDPDLADYPSNCWTWMIYGPFDLSESSDAELHFFYWNVSQLGRDTFSWGASTDGTSFDIAASVSGDSLGWQPVNYDLSSYTGEESVWIAFIFQSDASGTFQGPFVDDILLRTTDPSVVFFDGFESGDTSVWDVVVGEPPPPTDCDPVANTGCGSGEKCTFIATSQDPFEGHTGCAPDGTVALGDPCATDGGTGVDDCLGGTFCQGGTCQEVCTVTPDSCPTDYHCSHTAGIFDDNIGTCDTMCDLYAQDCDGGETCYMLLGQTDYPRVCSPTVPEPDTAHDGCEPVEKLVPQEQGECCSFINTCNVGLGCTQPDTGNSGLTCGEFCDPTGAVGVDDCLSKLGPGYYCISINSFYVDVSDLEDFYGFCIDASLWGPATCFNGVQDTDEDGVDCCAAGGDPDCECMFSCG